MAWVSIMSILIGFTVGSQSYFDAWLLPTIPGKPSKIIPIAYDNDKNGETWLQYDDGEANYVLVGLDDADTLCVYFEPPEPCSVLAMEICAMNYYGSANNAVLMFIALTDTDLTLDDWNEYHSGDPIPGPSPILQFVAGPITSKPLSSEEWTWDTLWIPQGNVPDVGTNPFVAGWIKPLNDSSPNPRITPEMDPPWHSIIHRYEPFNGGAPGWYASWHQFWIRALVRIYELPAVNVWIPDTSGMSGDTVLIPILTEDLTGLDVYSVGTEITFDTSVIVACDVINSGCITEDWGPPTYNIVGGNVTIGMAGISPLEGSGPLVYIKFYVVGSPGATTTLHFHEFIFNEGTPSANTIDGSFNISVGIEENITPSVYAIELNSSNPFKGRTVIKYQLPEQTWVTIKVYNLEGRLVATLVNDMHEAGYYALTWYGCDDKGALLPTGVYFCVMQTSNWYALRKMIIIR